MTCRRIHAVTDTRESESAIFSPPLHGEGPGGGLFVGVSEIAEAALPHALTSPHKGRGEGERPG
jgi:hypothetical protein